MSDAYEQTRHSVDEYLEAIPRLEGQCGLLALVDGKVMGLDLLSRPFAYEELHDKLLRSYAFEGIWYDIGRPDDYETFLQEFAANEERFLPTEKET